MQVKHYCIILFCLANYILLLDSELPVAGNALNFCKVPLLVAERADGTRLEPALDAVQMKDVAAIAKGDRQAVLVGGRRIGLVFDARLVERIAANGALYCCCCICVCV